MRIPAAAAIVAGTLVLSALTSPPAYAAWDTVITSGPAQDAKILPGDVTFTFTTNEGGTTGYECQLNDASAFVACNTGTITYSNLAVGAYVFRVKGTVLGQTDPTPAERSFIIRNVPCEEATAQYNAATSSFFKHHTKLGYTKEKLQRAKDAGNQALIEKYTKKKKRLKKLIKADRAAMDAALAQQDAVC
jgi:hypothetical protein